MPGMSGSAETRALHFGVSVALSAGGYAGSSLFLEKPWQRALAGSLFSLSVGAGKEGFDAVTGGDPSFKDFAWDAAGTLVGAGIAFSVDVAWLGEYRDGRGLDVGIIGAGFAGTATALFLARAGHRVTLYEEAPSPSAIGAGILIQPTGQRVLGELGLLEKAVACGSKVEKLLCLTSQGKAVLDLTYDDFEPGWFGLGMHRGALFELLFDAALGAGVDVRSGCSVPKLDHAHGRVSPLTSSGARLGEHELVVVADGARSELREARDTKRARPYPWGALWFVARDPGRVFTGCLHQITDSTTALLGFLPSGTGPSAVRGPDLVSIFWSVRTRELGQKLASLDDWKRAVTRLEPRAEAVLDQIRDPEQLLPASYLDVVMSRWHSERVVVIGDAGHAMSPQLGQGTNLALEDARVLAACLESPLPLDEQLATLRAVASGTCATTSSPLRWLTPFFQSRHHPLGELRDFAMGSVCRFPRPARSCSRRSRGSGSGCWVETSSSARSARTSAPNRPRRRHLRRPRERSWRTRRRSPGRSRTRYRSPG